MNCGSIVIHRIMKDYPSEYRNFSLSAPEKFSFPLDVFDKWENRPALFWTDRVNDKKFSFAELKLLSSKGAGALKNRGICKGDKVLVMLPGIPEWWEIMLALMRINAIAIPATTLLTSKDIEHRLASADIKAIIASDEDAPKVEEAVNSSGTNPILILIYEHLSTLPSIPSHQGRGKFEETLMQQKTSPRSPLPSWERASVRGKNGWHNYIKERDTADAFEGERAFHQSRH